MLESEHIIAPDSLHPTKLMSDSLLNLEYFPAQKVPLFLAQGHGIFHAAIKQERQSVSTLSQSRKNRKEKGFRTSSNLCGFEHDLRGVIEEGEGALGESVGAHEHGGEAHVGPPRVHHLLHGEPLQPYEAQVHEPLHEREVPSVAAAVWR
jgi:hypothetical protein